MLGNENEYGIVTNNNEDDLFEAVKKIILDKKLYLYYKEKIQLREKMFDINKSISEVEQLI